MTIIVIGASVKWHARIAAEVDAQNVLISYVHFLTPKLAARGLRESPFDCLVHSDQPPTKKEKNDEHDDGA
jgi:hypothetical protein